MGDLNRREMVDEDMFDHIKFADDTLSHAKSAIKMKLSIDWNNVNWTDLRKPLYSGLAAALYIRKYSNFTIPNSIESQALLWKTIYRPQKQEYDFYHATINLKDCTQSSLLDVALLLDTSSVQSFVNLAEAKIFYQDLINLLPVNEHITRVAVITFGNTPKSVISHLMSIIDIQASTSVVYPLPELLDIFKNSGRPEAAKYAIMITGSRSGEPMKTLAASGILADEGIMLYTIGIGNQITEMDLQRITTGPVCSHIKMLPSYELLTKSLANDITGLMCNVPLVVKSGVHHFKCGIDTLVRIPRYEHDRTITINTGD
ncbi:hypothetical protein KUTeg_022377 [Tegillarca granosa]|uniref:VWFA domain-containing protein n=1 Tax=Tegillarca granosa TaxID=220873 RepID=A0ABQ9E622_TEGGR|nr:hypothetical protein KUTeg_022377 [Tegillarca granosa]